MLGHQGCFRLYWLLNFWLLQIWPISPKAEEGTRGLLGFKVQACLLFTWYHHLFFLLHFLITQGTCVKTRGLAFSPAPLVFPLAPSRKSQSAELQHCVLFHFVCPVFIKCLEPNYFPSLSYHKSMGHFYRTWVSSEYLESLLL